MVDDTYMRPPLWEDITSSIQNIDPENAIMLGSIATQVKLESVDAERYMESLSSSPLLSPLEIKSENKLSRLQNLSSNDNSQAQGCQQPSAPPPSSHHDPQSHHQQPQQPQQQHQILQLHQNTNSNTLHINNDNNNNSNHNHNTYSILCGSSNSHYDHSQLDHQHINNGYISGNSNNVHIHQHNQHCQHPIQQHHHQQQQSVQTHHMQHNVGNTSYYNSWQNQSSQVCRFYACLQYYPSQKQK